MVTSLHSRPEPSEYAPFYRAYVAAVRDGDIVTIMIDSGRQLAETLATIPPSSGGFRYAEGKWTIGEVIGHVIDAERIFTYRSLRFARGDATAVPGFDQNDYVRTADSFRRSIADLSDELRTVRESSVRLFTSLPDDAWSRRGTASGAEITVRALAYVTVGHAQHHLKVLQTRYLIDVPWNPTPSATR